jgi:hypothetical protein
VNASDLEQYGSGGHPVQLTCSSMLLLPLHERSCAMNGLLKNWSTHAFFASALLLNGYNA